MNEGLSSEVRLSLFEAGIGRRYHDLMLGDVKHGAGMLEYLKRRGKAIRQGQGVAFHGIGMTDAIIMLARGLHINGVGCKVVPLVRMRGLINDPEFREQVMDADVLVVLNAQDTNRGNPLHDSVAAEVEYTIRRRHENGKAIFLQLAIEEDTAMAEMPNCYWTGEMIEFISEHLERVTPTGLKAMEPR
jgi:hypothetical protein